MGLLEQSLSDELDEFQPMAPMVGLVYEDSHDPANSQTVKDSTCLLDTTGRLHASICKRGDLRMEGDPATVPTRRPGAMPTPIVSLDRAIAIGLLMPSITLASRSASASADSGPLARRWLPGFQPALIPLDRRPICGKHVSE